MPSAILEQRRTFSKIESFYIMDNLVALKISQKNLM
jgi:hypothetical protein